MNNNQLPFPDMDPAERFKLTLYASLKHDEDHHTQRYRLIQFICQQMVFAVIISVCLYNLSVGDTNREIWLGLFCTILGSITSNSIGKLKFKKEDGLPGFIRNMRDSFSVPQQDDVDGIGERNIPRNLPKRTNETRI